MCTFRRPTALRRLLAALDLQTVAPASIQVVDDDATDRGPAWGRNVAWRRGQAPVVAFTDDDCVPDPDWIERLATRFADEDAVAAVEGRVMGLDPEGHRIHLDPPRRVRWDRFRTANMAYRREWLERLGGFDEGYHIHREDTDLAWRALQQGARIVRAPEAVVLHPDRPGEARQRPASERRLFHLDPRRYAECAAAAVNVASWRSGRLQALHRQLRAPGPTGSGSPPTLTLGQATWLWSRAAGIAVRWKVGNLLGRR